MKIFETDTVTDMVTEMMTGDYDEYPRHIRRANYYGNIYIKERFFNIFFPSSTAAPSKYRRKEQEPPNLTVPLYTPSPHAIRSPWSAALPAGRPSPRLGRIRRYGNAGIVMLCFRLNPICFPSSLSMNPTRERRG